MMDSLEKRRRLVRELVSRTVSGKLRWVDDGNGVFASFSNNAVSLSLRGDDYSLRLLNSEGNVVEVITDEELDLGAEEVSGKSYFEPCLSG